MVCLSRWCVNNVKNVYACGFGTFVAGTVAVAGVEYFFLVRMQFFEVAVYGHFVRLRLLQVSAYSA